MSTEIETGVMQQIHEIATEEFGRMAEPLPADGMVQQIYLPGGSYALVIAPAQADAVGIFQRVGEPDLSCPGVAEFLLREHAQWVFGRLELIEEGLFVQSSLPVSQLSPESLRRVVLAVHHMACKTEEVLMQTGVLREPEEDEG